MTKDPRTDHDLSRSFERLRAGPTPDYTEALLSRTAAIRPRPAWMVIGRWFPMEVVTEHVGGPRLSWRVVALVALVIAALALGGVLVAGSHDRRIPAPFGPARNGVVVYDYWRAGDLFLGDAAGRPVRQLTTGPDFDTIPSVSRDGASVAFVRSTTPGASAAGSLMVVDVDGSDLRALSGPSLIGVSGIDWSADGRLIAVTSLVTGVPSITVIDVQSASARVLDLGMTVSGVSFRPPTGDELLFVGETAGLQALYLVRPDGSQRREVLEAPAGITRPAWSPDGTRIAYTQGSRLIAPGPTATHVVDADGSGDRVLHHPAGVDRQVFPAWSPDGQSLLVGRMDVGGEMFRLAVVAVDGNTPDRESPLIGWPIGGPETVLDWSPDGDVILIDTSDGGVAIDAASFARTSLTGWFDAAWQRVGGD